jgi:hypothetical protein
MILEFIDILEDVETHIEHPEDLVFTEGTAGAIRGFQSLNLAISQPKNVTIKYDGFPALIFGRNVDGVLSVVDKHMFTKKDGSGRHIASVDQFAAYDAARGVNRSDLYKKLQVLWPLFEQAVPVNARGYYWGDLLWTGVPPVQNADYVFKPNTVTYHVPVQSDLGKQIGSCLGGIVVHQYFSDYDSPPSVLKGTGQLNLDGQLCILTPQIADRVNLKTPVQLEKKVNLAIQKYGPAVDELINPANLSTLKVTNLPSLMKQYINARLRGESRTFIEWLPTKLSTPKMQRLIGDTQDGYLIKNKTGVEGAFAINAAITAAKNNVIQQMDNQQRSIKATVNGALGGEGYVVVTTKGLIKLVNRTGFSAANFAKNP